MNTNLSLQSFRKMVQDNWIDMRRAVFVEAAQSHGILYFRYNPQKNTYNLISDTWVYKLQKYGKELGDIDNEISCFRNEIACELSLDHNLIKFLGTEATDEPGYLSEKILKSLIYKIEKQLTKNDDNIIPFPQKREGNKRSKVNLP